MGFLSDKPIESQSSIYIHGYVHAPKQSPKICLIVRKNISILLILFFSMYERYVGNEYSKSH